MKITKKLFLRLFFLFCFLGIIKTNYVFAQEGDDCAICSMEMKVGEKVCKLPCNHIFHYDCIATWFRSESTEDRAVHDWVDPASGAVLHLEDIPKVHVAKKYHNECPICRKVCPSSLHNKIISDSPDKAIFVLEPKKTLHSPAAASSSGASSSQNLVNIISISGIILDEPEFFSLAKSAAPPSRTEVELDQFKEALAKAISLDVDLNYSSPKNANTALHWAIINHKEEIAEELIKANVKLNLQNSDGDTPLHLAVKNKMGRIINLLLQKNANKAIYNFFDMLPFDIAFKANDQELMDLLVS